MMKYTKAEMELVEFEVEDIIRTSGDSDIDNRHDEDDAGWD